MYNGQFEIRSVPLAGPLSCVVVASPDVPLSELLHAARKEPPEGQRRGGRGATADESTARGPVGGESGNQVGIDLVLEGMATVPFVD